MSTIRQEQIQNRLIEEISDMIRRDLKDPRLELVTVTSAEVTRDLRYAKVYVSIMGDEEQQKGGLAALRKVAGYMRGEFARRMHLRLAPEIDFRADIGIPRGARIFELLHTVEEDVLKPDEPGAEAE
jgi:ribosome-binding factor A